MARANKRKRDIKKKWREEDGKRLGDDMAIL